MNLVGTLHGSLVADRRSGILASIMSSLIPADALSVVDIGCGDGTIMHLVQSRRPALDCQGFEVLLRPERQGKILPFDGQTIPLADQSVDVAMFVDVLHHTVDPLVLLREAARVARRAVVIKDHCRDGFLAQETLRLMDWVGNAHHGVALPYNYWSEAQWREAFEELQLSPVRWQHQLRLYPAPVSWCCDRKLHFAACLAKVA